MTNEGTLDRFIRIALGTAVISLAFIGPKTPWAYIGFIPFVTGIIGFCPLYRVVGVSTCSTSGG